MQEVTTARDFKPFACKLALIGEGRSSLQDRIAVGLEVFARKSRETG
jgi:hypothetical protein